MCYLFITGRPLRPRTRGRLARAAHGPGGLDRVERRALLSRPAVEEYPAIESLRVARKEPETAAFPQADERPGEEFDGDGALFREEQMRHGRPMHADDDVRVRHGDDGRARRRWIVPVKVPPLPRPKTALKRWLAACKTRARNRGEREGYGGPRDVTSLSLSLSLIRN